MLELLANENIDAESSKMIEKAEYRPLYHELDIWFKSTGAKYTYKGVSEETWQEFKSAESKGKYFHKFIKNIHKFSK